MAVRPPCLDPSEFSAWSAANDLLPISTRARSVCGDCTVEFSVTARSAGCCDGTPGVDPPKVRAAQRVYRPQPGTAPTPAELRYVALITTPGATAQTAAAAAGVSASTVHQTIERLHRRLGVRSTAQAVRVLYESGVRLSG